MTITIPRASFASVRTRTSGLRLRDFGVVFSLVILFVALSTMSPVFLSSNNLLNVLTQWAPIGIMALGGSAVLLTGGFDLSTGAIFVSSGVAATMVAESVSVPVGVLAGVGAGAALGAINGLLGTVGRMNVFVATLGSSIVFTGLATAVTGGTVQIVSDAGYGFAQNKPLGVSVGIWVFIVATVLIWALFRRTVLGRYLYATGGNREAARLAGVRTELVRFSAFTIAGASAGVAAVLLSSMSLSAGTSSGNAVAYSVWTAMLIGGNSMLGGEGAIWRTLAGVALLALIQNGFNLLGVEPLYQQMATGMILLLAIGMDAWGRSKAGQR